MRVLVDCDPGIDDAIALLGLAADPDVEIVGVGTVHGNVPPDIGARNARYTLALGGARQVPIAVGCSTPLSGLTSRSVGHAHGPTGLGERQLPESSSRTAVDTAADQIVEAARRCPGGVDMLAIAPLTNLAKALQIEPELPWMLGRVTIMGGAFGHQGNSSAVAEANFWHDSDAADTVFAAGFDITVVGLDVTTAALFPDWWRGQLRENGTAVAHFCAEILEYYARGQQHWLSEGGSALHDPVAAAVAVDPSLADRRELGLAVLSTEDARRGCLVECSARPPVEIATALDVRAVLERLGTGLGIPAPSCARVAR